MKSLSDTYIAIEDADEPVLRYLVDVRREKAGKFVLSLSCDIALSQDFRLVFEFAKNEYFSNTELTKTFLLDETGRNCKETVGTQILWAPGRDVTFKLVPKRFKRKRISFFYLCLVGSKEVREVNKLQPASSFFNFFKSHKAADNTSDSSSNSDGEPEEHKKKSGGKEREAIENELDMATALSEKLIPEAALYYFGVRTDIDESLSGRDNSWEDDSDEEEKSETKKEKDCGSDEDKEEHDKDCKQQ